MEIVKGEIMIIDSEKLLYHNQFILGPVFVEELALWKRIKINNAIYLTVHPDLNACQAFYGDKSITLLGFILDPDNPQISDSDIINDLIHELFIRDNFLDYIYKYGGRWILIVNDGKETRLFNDAAGLRQVFYIDIRYTADLWCASQPGIIAEMLSLQMDHDAVDFINSYEFRKNPEYRWPGYSTPYKQIKHLLPNHYLDLNSGVCTRYWPNKPLENIPLNQAVEEVSSMLTGQLEGASKRFDLALSITAGLDSRIVLASSKKISTKVSYMTVRQIGMPDNHADVTIPSSLFHELGLNHDIVKSSLLMNDEFFQIFHRNIPLAHYVYAPDAYAILNHYGQQKVAVTGSASEIARSSFRSQLNKSRNEKITAEDLAFLQNMGENQFALNAFEQWLLGIKSIYNYDILDLFEWEQGHGNWLAMCQLEFDIAWKDIFTPFNCRNLLITLLSVDEQYRKPLKYELFERIILNLWPEVLNVPINPHIKKSNNNPAFKTQISRFVPAFVKKVLRRHLV